MVNKKKKIILLVILDVLLISTVIIFGYFASKNDVIKTKVEVVGEDLPTTIYISLSIPPWLILINALLLISIDLIIITIINTIKHIKKIEISKLRYKIPSVFIINLALSLFIPTNMFVVLTLIAMVITVLLFIEKKVRKENDKNKIEETAL